MMEESQKKESQKIISNLGRQISDKRATLNKLKGGGEDYISSIMGGKIPEAFNDPILNSRYNRLNICERKLDELKVSSNEAILQNNVNGEVYLNHLKMIKVSLEKDIEQV